MQLGRVWGDVTKTIEESNAWHCGKGARAKMKGWTEMRRPLGEVKVMLFEVYGA